jgi:hypothetical protein
LSTGLRTPLALWRRPLLALVEPAKESGMADYRLEDVADPQHHQAAADRLPKILVEADDLLRRRLEEVTSRSLTWSTP